MTCGRKRCPGPLYGTWHDEFRVLKKDPDFLKMVLKRLYVLPRWRGTADIHATNSVPPTRASQEHFRDIQFPLGILEFCPLCEVKLPAPVPCGIPSSYRTPSTTPGAKARRPSGSGRYRPGLQIGQEGIGGFWGQKSELGSNAAGAGGATEQAAQLTHRKAIHCQLQEIRDDDQRTFDIKQEWFMSFGLGYNKITTSWYFDLSFFLHTCIKQT